MPHEEMGLYVPLLFMAVPVVAVVALALVVRRNRRAGRVVRHVPDGWVRAPWPGVVTDEETWVRHHGSGTDHSTSSVVHRPIVTYRAPTGVDVTFRSHAWGTFMPRPGASVAVVHDPRDPRQARLAPESVPRTFQRLGVVAFVFAVVVLVPLTVLFEGVGYFLLTHR